jgi:hypothetical protein
MMMEPDGRSQQTQWSSGDLIDVDTEDGIERARILGPSSTGNLAEMRVLRFSDGIEDDWETIDFRPAKCKCGQYSVASLAAIIHHFAPPCAHTP